MRLLSCWFGVSLLLLGSFADLFAQGATGTVRGTVRSAASNHLIEGASIAIAAVHRATQSEADGSFFVGGLAAGEYLLAVSSAGFEERTVPVTVRAGADARVDVRLDSPVVMLSAMTITSQAEGQAQALNLQRASESIRKIASQDALAAARAGEVGEALQTLPGVYLEVSTHQPSRAVLRGIQSQYNSVTFDGVRAGNTDGDRADTVSAFPAESLQRVELFKSVTPDLPGDAIGGAINLVSRRAFDLSGPLLRLTLGATYNDQQRNWDVQGNFDFGRTFLNDKLGILLSVNHYRSDRGYHEATMSYAVDAADRFSLSNLTLLDRVEDDSWKFKMSGSVEYKLSRASTLSFSGMFSEDTRSLEDRRFIVSGGSRTYLSADRGTLTGARLGLDRRYRVPVSTTKQFGGGARHDFDLWKIDYRLSYFRSDNSYDETFYPALRSPATNFAYDRSDRRFPSLTSASGVNFNNPAIYEQNVVQRSQSPSHDQGVTLQANARRELPDLFQKSYLKTGLNYSSRWWAMTGQGLGTWSYTGPQPASAFLEPYVNPHYLNEADGRLLVPAINVSLDKFLDAFRQRPNEFTRQALTSDLLILQRTQSVEEKIGAAYAMGSFTFGQLNLLTGARVETTDFTGKAYRVNQTTTDIRSVTRPETSLDDVQVLPGLHLNYTFMPRLIGRAAIYKTLARPAGVDLLPASTINDTARTISEGNPNLGVTTSTNYDVSLEYYLLPIGVLSAGAFEKNIHGFYYDSSGTIVGGDYDGYTLNNRSLGLGGKVSGLEVEWQQRMTFLPQFLSNFTLGGNFTWIRSRGEYPARPGSNLTFTGTATRNGNFNVSYGIGGFNIRAYYHYRGDFLSSIGGRPALDVYERARKTIDVLVRYSPRQSKFAYQISAKNLGNDPKMTYQGDRSNPRSVRYFDWSISSSVSYSF